MKPSFIQCFKDLRTCYKPDKLWIRHLLLFFRFYFNITLHQRHPPKPSTHIRSSPLCATFPAQLMILDWITRKTTKYLVQSENHEGRYYKHFSASRYLPPLRPDYLLHNQQTIFFPYAKACVLHPNKTSCKVLWVLCILGFAILHFLFTVIKACHKTSMLNTRETKCRVFEYESSEALKHSTVLI